MANVKAADPKAVAKAAAAAAKEKAAEVKAALAGKATADKAAAAEKEAAKVKKAAEAAAAREVKKAEKEAEKKAAAEKRETDKAQRESLKGGPGKRLRSLIARIKYMIYMDNPSAGISDIELLTWVLTLTNSEGVVYTVTRGETVATVIFTVKAEGKKLQTIECAANQEALEEVVGEFSP